jgi:hypothetical protein
MASKDREDPVGQIVVSKLLGISLEYNEVVYI